MKDVENELKQDKQLIELTAGCEDDGSFGSDSGPSEDNLDDDELAQLVSDENKPTDESLSSKAKGKKVVEKDVRVTLSGKKLQRPASKNSSYKLKKIG